ncbi:MAG: hypothetical protein AAF196_20735 [Planctomycetota bacterium]
MPSVTIGVSIFAQNEELPPDPVVQASQLDAWSAGDAIGQTLSFPISAGEDRLLVVAVATEDNFASGTRAEVTGVTYGGQALTEVVFAEGVSTDGTQPRNRISFFILPEAGIAAASGTGVIVSTAADGGTKWRCASFQDVKQSALDGIRGFAVDSNSSPLALTGLTVFDGDFVVAGWHASGAGLVPEFAGLLVGDDVFLDPFDNDPFAVAQEQYAGGTLIDATITANGGTRYALAGLVIAGRFDADATPNAAPTADAGPDVFRVQGGPVQLDGSGSSDPTDPLVYSWTQTAGPTVTLAGADTATPTFTAPSVAVDTPLTFELSVSDGVNPAATDSVTVTVVTVNQPPVANAGVSRSVFDGSSVMLDGSGSSDREDQLAYSWTQISGPVVALSGATTATPSFTAPDVSSNSNLVFDLSVDDGSNPPETDTVTITVMDSPAALEILPEDRRTIWDPGVYGGIPADDAVVGVHPGGVGPAIQHGSALSPSGGDDRDAIQAALDAAGAAASLASRRIVQLAAGTFQMGSVPIVVPSYVTLRGTMSGTTRQTIIDQAPANREMINLTGGFASWGTPVNCVGSQIKGSDTITVADASGFAVGDIISIDQSSDGSMWGTPGSGTWPGGPINPTFGDFVRPTTGPTGKYVAFGTSLFYHRQDYANGFGIEPFFPNSSTWRHISQRCEILAINGNDLTIYDPNAADGKVGAPLHMTYYAGNDPQVYRVSGVGGDVVRYAGLEDIKLNPAGTNGQRTVQLQRAYCCWVRNVETDGAANEWSGRHMQLYPHTLRCQIEGCYVHQSASYFQGANGYGINIAGSGNLITNNVAWELNKPIVLEGSCGGNVISYNYADDAVIARTGIDPGTGQPYPPNDTEGFFQEAAISTHGSFCYFDLFEGNYTPNVTIDATHGNNDKEVIFRNHCTGRNQNGFASAYERAISSDGWNWDVSAIGNVHWTPSNASEINAVFSGRNDPISGGNEWVYLLGSNAWHVENQNKPGAQQLDDGMAAENFYVHLDYNYGPGADGGLITDGANPVTSLPSSLYLESAPSFFDGQNWPWVYPQAASHAERVLTLPAKARFDAGEA